MTRLWSRLWCSRQNRWHLNRSLTTSAFRVTQWRSQEMVLKRILTWDSQPDKRLWSDSSHRRKAYLNSLAVSKCPDCLGCLALVTAWVTPCYYWDNVFYHTLQYPCECCPFLKKNSYICRVKRLSRLTLHIVKVFFASPFLKMWKFSYWKDGTEQHSLRVDSWG